MLDSADLRARLTDVRTRIARAAGRAGRDPASVRLVAVSKTFPAEYVRVAAEAGQIDFGENRVQDGLEKMDLTADPIVKGRFTGRFTPTAAGDYVLTYAAAGEQAPIEARLRAINAADELRQPNLNRPLLEQIATTSTGALVELTELPTIEKRLEGESKSTPLHREASLWDNWMTLALLVTLYTIDVGIRRLMGLS